MKLKDKVAIITGGGRGIGKAVALAYAREGAKLALCARTGAELEQTVEELHALKAAAEGWTCDVTLEEGVKEFVANTYKKFGRIDVLVNNAGVMTRPVPMTELDVKKWDYTIAVNLRGPFLVTQAVLPIMQKQKSGSIISVSSMIGRGAYANFLAYARRGSALVEYPRQLRRARLRGHEIDRVQRQRAGVGDGSIRLSCVGRVQRRHGENAEFVRLEVADQMNGTKCKTTCPIPR